MNHIETDFEDQVRQMLRERAADVPDRPRQDVVPIPSVRGGAPAAGSRRRLQIAVAAAAVVLALAAGLVLRPNETSEVSTVPADSIHPTTGLPSDFDASTAAVVFSAPGDADAVTDAYLRDRFPDYATLGVVTGPAKVDGTEAVATWTLTHEGFSEPYGGAVLLRSNDGVWGVVAATTDGVNLDGVSFDGRRVQGRITYSGIDHLAADVTDLAGEPVEGAPHPNGYPGAEYRFGTAGDTDTGSLDLDLAATDRIVVVRAQYVGGTLLSVAELALVAPPIENADRDTGPVVWPNEVTTTDRSSPARVATSFTEKVIGRIPSSATPDPDAAPDGPTWVELHVDGAVVRLLAAPAEDGWVVLQVGDGGPTLLADPPTAHPARVAGATDIEIRLDTIQGLDVVHLPADRLADGVPIAAKFDEVRSIIAIYRDAGGAVIAVHGGHYG